MNRTKKNILSIIITLLLTACIGFTVYQIKSQNTPPAAPTGQMQQQQSGGNSDRNNVDNSGIMIYQSMSDDASTGTGTFTAKNSSLSVSKNSSYYKKSPMFFVTNTDAVINLTNTKLSYGSNTLLSVKGTSEWGQSGSNGGTVKLNASKQTLTGNIIK